MRTLTALLFAGLLATPAAHADVGVVVVGAYLGGSPAGGDPAPDGDGVFFGSGVPVINDAGQVAFYSSFTTGSGGTAAVRGSAAAGSLRIVVRQQDPAPDGNGNFGLLGEGDAPPINNAGQVAIPARFVGTFGPDDTSGVVRGDVAPDAPTLVARSGQTVDGVKLLGLSTPPPALNASGQVVFRFLVSSAIFLSSGGSNTVVARNGQAAPDGSGTFVFVTSVPPAINDLGQVAFAALVSGGTGSSIEFLRAEGSTIIQVVRNGDPAPDHNGTFDLLQTVSVLQAPALNEAGELAFVASLSGVTGPGTEGIFRASDPDHVVTIVRRGDAAPDGNGSFLDFDFGGINIVALNDAGQAAFLTTLTGTAEGTADNLGIFRGDGTDLVRVVRKGDPAPDGDGSFVDFDHPAINAAGQVAFRATLDGTPNTQGIFLYDDVRGLIQVVRHGEALLGESIALLGFAPDTSRGRKHTGLNAHGQVAFQFGLVDGRVGVAIWSLGSSTTTTSTSTTIQATSTTSTTLGGTSSTTTTTTVGSTSSTTTTSTTPNSSATTTTLPLCTTLRCFTGAARNGPVCGDETVPASVAKKLELAVAQAELAPSQTAKKASRLYKSVGHLLTKARKLTMKAAHGRHPRLSTECAADLVNAIRQGSALVGPSK